MKKISAHPFRVYSGSRGKITIFDEETLNYAEVGSSHLVILNAFKIARDPKKVIISMPLSKQKEAWRVLKELDELGFFSRSKSIPYPKVFNLNPDIRAFRIALTEECNLKCPECFVTKNRNNLKTMSHATLETVIKKTISYGTSEKITYHFFGGEPLIRFDHIKRTVDMVNEAVKTRKMIKPFYTMTTNLTFLNDNMIRFFKKNDFKIGVSIDGPENINNKFRIYKNGRGSFKDTKHNYYRLIKAGIDTHVLITPHAGFLDQLPKIFRGTLKTFPSKTITINTPFHYRSLAWNIDGEKYAQILVKLVRIARKNKVTIDSAASPILFSLANNIKRHCPCMFNNGYIMASISTEGHLSFCSQNWNDVLLTNFKGKMNIPIKRISQCSKCEARHICGGPCPAFQIISGKEIDRQKCRFMQTILKEIAMNAKIFGE
ncbi:MAG: radical SAM protein [Patescibacteria group bacterium]|nr:radical SAM protein [Patescibacteria group bacterium]